MTYSKDVLLLNRPGPPLFCASSYSYSYFSRVSFYSVVISAFSCFFRSQSMGNTVSGADLVPEIKIG